MTTLTRYFFFLIASCVVLFAIPVARTETPATAPNAPQPPATQPQPATQLATLQFPTFGLALSDPPGFRRMAEGGPNRVAQWARINAAGTSEITSLIFVEVEAADGRTLKDYATSTAANNGGHLGQKTITVNGATAYQITANLVYKPFVARKFVITQHEDQFYVISAMETEGDNCDAALAAICNSIKWLKIEDVSRHLDQMRGDPVTVFDRMQIKFPAAMRGAVVENAAAKAHWALLNLKTNREELVIDFQLGAFDHRYTFDDIRAGYGELLRKRFGLDHEVAWKKANGALPADAKGGSEIWTTDPIDVVVGSVDPDPSAKDQVKAIRWALVNVNTHVVVIIFNMGDRPAEQEKIYNAAVDRIIGTIKTVDAK